MTNTEPGFYGLMGPLLSRREIVKELGFPVYDDDGKTWVLAVHDGRVVGFSGLRVERGTAALVSAWVRPDWRGKGLYRRMVAERMRLAREAGANRAKATATAASCRALGAAGLVFVRAIGRYTKMEMDI